MIYLSIKYNLVYVSCFCMTLGNCMIYWVVRRVDMVDMADGELLCQGWSCLHSLCGQADQRAATWPSTVEATVWSYGFCSWDGLYWQLVAAAESVSEFLCGGAIRCNFSMGIILWSFGTSLTEDSMAWPICCQWQERAAKGFSSLPGQPILLVSAAFRTYLLQYDIAMRFESVMFWTFWM